MSDESTSGAPAPQDSPQTDQPSTGDAPAGRRWRRATRLMGRVVEAHVLALARNALSDDPEPDDQAIRKISSLVIASQRAMEMEDNYARRIETKRLADRAADGGAGWAEEARRLLELNEQDLRRALAAGRPARDGAGATAREGAGDPQSLSGVDAGVLAGDRP